jgi:hypothetical protein
MQVDLCRHIKSNGIQCHAVALSNSVFCYFHSRLQPASAVVRPPVRLNLIAPSWSRHHPPHAVSSSQDHL